MFDEVLMFYSISLSKNAKRVSRIELWKMKTTNSKLKLQTNSKF